MNTRLAYGAVGFIGMLLAALIPATVFGALVVPFTETFSSVTSTDSVHLGYDERWDPGVNTAPGTTEYQFDPVDVNWDFGPATGGSVLVTNPLDGDQAIALNETGLTPPAIPGVAITSSPIMGFVVGQQYLLTFDHWGDDKPNTNPYEVDIELDSTLIGHLSRTYSFQPPSGSFATASIFFVATAASHTLSFLDVTRTTHGSLAEASAIIDNVSIIAIPEARPYLVMSAVVVLVGLCSVVKRGRAHWLARGLA